MAVTVVPPPTFQDFNFADAAVWNLISGATTATDKWGSVKAIGVSTSSRVAHLGTMPIANASGAIHSITCWFSTTNTTGTEILMSQRDTGGGASKAVWDIVLNSSGNLNPSFFSSTNASNGVTSSSSASYNNGALRHFGMVVNGNSLKVYVGGVEIAYVLKDFLIGSGFTGVPASGGDNLTALGFSGSGFGLSGQCTRPKFWQARGLTDAEMLQEAKNEEGKIINTLTTGNLYADGSLYKD